MSFKDYFSRHSEEYSKYRPTYPAELYKYLWGICEYHDSAWDCATGNGQAAVALAEYFDNVYATDASEEQIRNAFPHPKVKYSVALAESSGLRNKSVDLVTVATAIHWFNKEKFSEEVKRVIKPGGIAATWNYIALRVNPQVNNVLDNKFKDIINDYWDEKLQKVFKDNKEYELPFKKLSTPEIKMEYEWNLVNMINFLNTWSAVQSFIEKNNKNPIELIYDDFKNAWGNEEEKKKVNFKFILKVYSID
jgi:SAM-dependent methyltransferase